LAFLSLRDKPLNISFRSDIRVRLLQRDPGDCCAGPLGLTTSFSLRDKPLKFQYPRYLICACCSPTRRVFGLAAFF